ncbi:flagellar basal body rod C-terminal domain-containing protein, partial [Acinetobacter baumannii]
GAGTFSSSSLEQSNVDISTEFTNLIKAQQVYTANSKVVTTDNSLLQVTINMIQ